MDGCERWFGALFCEHVGKGKCAFAVIEALNDGNVADRDCFLGALRGREYDVV